MPSRKVPAYVDSTGIINTAHPAFHHALGNAKLDDFPEQQRLDSPLDKVLWALWILKDHFKHDHHADSSVSAYEISSILETRGIALTEVQIERALARANERVHRKKIYGDETKRNYYKIMESGKAYLQSKYSSEAIHVHVVDGATPWTDRHKTFGGLAALLKGHVCVLDKFYGAATLGILHHFKHAKSIRFLTAKTNESPAAFKAELNNFRRECPVLDVRIYPNQHELHDRYVLTSEALLVIGHGIKDLGSKESFVLMLKGEIAEDIRSALQTSFDARWNVSTPVV